LSAKYKLEVSNICEYNRNQNYSFYHVVVNKMIITECVNLKWAIYLNMILVRIIHFIILLRIQWLLATCELERRNIFEYDSNQNCSFCHVVVNKMIITECFNLKWAIYLNAVLLIIVHVFISSLIISISATLKGEVRNICEHNPT
jgi:hypothetical protein